MGFVFYRRIKKKNKTQRTIQVRVQCQADIIVKLLTAQYPLDMDAFICRGVLTSHDIIYNSKAIH